MESDCVNLNSTLQVQSFHLSFVQTTSLTGVVPGRERGDASPSGG